MRNVKELHDGGTINANHGRSFVIMNKLIHSSWSQIGPKLVAEPIEWLVKHKLIFLQSMLV